MNKILLPSGDSVGNFTIDTKFNIAGLGICTQLILQLIEIVRAKFNYDLPIEYVYGSPSVRWNGGRISLKKNNDNIIDQCSREIDWLKSYQITPLFTFSNVTIDESDLDDPVSNELLALIAKTDSQIIVTSDVLKEYIQSKYPQIPLHVSVIKTAFEENRNVAYYENLSESYANYVVHAEDNFRPELLLLLPKSNAEIMLNERCNYSCTIRDKHYLSISEEQKTRLAGHKPAHQFLDGCQYIPEYKQAKLPYRNTSLTLEEAKAINRMGYRLFKLQGRTDGLNVYFFDLMRYMLEPNMAFPHLYPIFSFYIDQFIKESYSG